MKNDLIDVPQIKKTKKHINDYQTNLDKVVKVVLVGNPNVGKSCIFNHMSGMYVDVSNFPGTTVSITKSFFQGAELYDTPGIYGVSSFNDEERVAKDIILSADVVINVVNGLHLERDLFLTQQLIEMGKKVTLILNFSDVVQKKKIKINTQLLSELLGVEIIETSAVTKKGFDQLQNAVKLAKVGNQNLDLQFMLQHLIDKGISKAEALLIIEGDSITASKNFMQPGLSDDREKIYITRRSKVNEIVTLVEYEDSKKGEIFNQLGRLSLHPKTGVPILIVILSLVYFFIGDFVSQQVVDFTENKIGKELFEFNVKSFIANFNESTILVSSLDEPGNVVENKTFRFPNGMASDTKLKNEFLTFSNKQEIAIDFQFSNPILRLFFGEFGVITMTITYLFFLLLPLVIGFYFVMAILEDSGYLPRLATMMDRAFNKIGLNGKAVIPIMLGFGCITMANVTTRLLGTSREKTIVTAILQFVIPCSAQLAVITVLLSGAGLKPLLIFVTVITIVLITLSTLMHKLLPGESSPLLLDLPMMRIPRLDNILKKTFFRSYGFMKEAGVWFFIGAIIIGIFEIFGILEIWQNILAPLTTEWLKLPKETATAFVMGMVRRDFGAAGLFDLNLTSMQVTVAIITITLFVPCIASFIVMLKERGLKEGFAIWVATWISAFTIGGIVAQIII